MSIEDTTELIEYLSSYYSTFKSEKSKIKIWFQELQNYDFEDVKSRVKELQKEERYENYAPELMIIIKNLIPLFEKERIKGVKTTCQICGKLLLLNDYDTHFNKCMSIDYFIRENKKWFGKEYNRAECWRMERNEFERLYKELQRHIYKNTTDQKEKEFIGYIYNLPERTKTREFMEGVK